MKTKSFLFCLTTSGLLALTSGCGKNESTDSAPKSITPPPARAETVEPPKAAAQPAPVVTNTPAPVVSTPSPPAEIPAAPVETTRPATSILDKAKSVLPQASSGGSLADLSQDQLVQGLKDALGKGVQQAVAGLGHDNGFLTNASVKIPMPDKLQKVEKTLRMLKQDKMADDFVNTMNHAAEQAVPAAASVFVDSLKQMKIDDAKAILTGTNNAATEYFRRTTSTNLYAKFYPIVQQATQKTGVTAAYKNIVDKANMGQSLGGFGSSLGFDQNSMDIDAYVTGKALDGLFIMVANEEKQIRQNPVARTTDMLQKVFGALKN